MVTPSDQPGASPRDELRSLMGALGLHNAALARMVVVDKGAPGRWLSGDVEVPPWLLEHLRAVLALRSLCASLFPAPELPERLRHISRLSAAPSPEGNESIEIHTTEGMPATLSQMEQAQPMTADGFRDALARIGWRQADFARHVGCDVKTASRWATGAVRPIPAWVGVHLALLEQVQGLQRFTQPKRGAASGGP